MTAITATTLALTASLALGATGAAVQYSGQRAQAEAQEKGVKAQQDAEASRRRQMEIESSRRQREIIRQGVLQRAQTQAAAAASGGSGSSLEAGALGGITGQQAYNSQGVEHAEGLGQSIFSANQRLLGARREEAAAGSTVALGGGLSSLGNRISNNLGEIRRISASF
jgi:hypothetical protein